MAVTIQEINRSWYWKLRAKGLTHEEAFETYPFNEDPASRKHAMMTSNEAYFGTDSMYRNALQSYRNLRKLHIESVLRKYLGPKRDKKYLDWNNFWNKLTSKFRKL